MCDVSHFEQFHVFYSCLWIRLNYLKLLQGYWQVNSQSPKKLPSTTSYIATAFSQDAKTRTRKCREVSSGAAHQLFSFAGFQFLSLSARFRLRFWFGVRSEKRIVNRQLTRLGRPSDLRQVRKRFGFGQDVWAVKGETLRILQLTESEGSQLHCLIIRLSEVRVLVGPPIKSMS